MNKITLIIGATNGIGEACARMFVKNGYSPILTGRNQACLNQLTAESAHLNIDVITLYFDVRDRLAATVTSESLDEKWRSVDVLVSNVGLALGLEPEYEGNFDDQDTMIGTNIKELLTMTRLIVPGMVARNRGHTINIGSVAGNAAYASDNVHCATKAAVRVLSNGLRMDLVSTAVRATTVKPGLVQTSFSVTRFHGDQTRTGHVHDDIQPLTGDDIADVVLYAAQAPQYVQIAEVLVLTTHQANDSTISRNVARSKSLS